jgi:hypothetical protein
MSIRFISVVYILSSCPKESMSGLFISVCQSSTPSKYASQTTLSQARLRSTELLGKLKLPIGLYNNEKVAASLRIVRIDREPDGTLLISRQTFLDMFNVYELELYWLHMIMHSVYGLYQYHKPLALPEKCFIQTFYLNTVSYTLIWSHNTHQTYTREIIIPRKSDGIRNREAIFTHFLRSMTHHKSLVDHPCFLSFICAVELVH